MKISTMRKHFNQYIEMLKKQPIDAELNLEQIRNFLGLSSSGPQDAFGKNIATFNGGFVRSGLMHRSKAGLYKITSYLQDCIISDEMDKMYYLANCAPDTIMSPKVQKVLRQIGFDKEDIADMRVHFIEVEKPKLNKVAKKKSKKLEVKKIEKAEDASCEIALPNVVGSYTPLANQIQLKSTVDFLDDYVNSLALKLISRATRIVEEQLSIS